MYNRREATPVNGKIHAAPRREERRNHYTRKNCCLHREDDAKEKPFDGRGPYVGEKKSLLFGGYIIYNGKLFFLQ